MGHVPLDGIPDGQARAALGQQDPLFGIDLGFYLFRLPFNWFLYYLALVAVIVCLLSAVFLYLVEGGVWVSPRGPKVMGAARTHLMVLAAVLFVVFAYRVRLAMYGLLFSPRGLIYGAGYSDVHATLPVLRVELFLCLLTAVAFAAGRSGGGAAGALFRGPSGGRGSARRVDLSRDCAAFHRGP